MTKTRILRVALAIAGLLLVASSVWGSAGDLLWDEEFTIPLYPSITITAMSVSQTSIIICGNASGGTAPQQIGFVKAFDVTTGKLRWEHELVLGSQNNNCTAITVEGGIALVLGTAYGWAADPPPGYQLSKSIVRACYADTGQFLWETQHDIYQMAVGPTMSSSPVMASANNRTFLAGVVSTGGGAMPGKCIVRAFQVKNATMTPSMLLLD
jgi:outer membrane protein assembly factor BamB